MTLTYSFKKWWTLSAVFLCAACSTNNPPAPIKEQSVAASAPRQATLPNRTANNETKVQPPPAATKSKVSASNVQKSPAAQPVTQAPTDTSPAKVPAKENLVPDPAFRIAKPSSGAILEGFNGTSNKGIDYSGKLGDPISAVSDGKVIFSGNSLRSYGNLVIIKHDTRYITIYAHNSKNLVKEGDDVKRGQKIAEMGSTESDRVKLHFELRRDSKPIDPVGYFDS